MVGVDGSETGRALRIFHILCSDGLADICLLLADFVGRFLGVCSFRSSTMFASNTHVSQNRRTPYIGKFSAPGLSRSLGLDVVRWKICLECGRY